MQKILVFLLAIFLFQNCIADQLIVEPEDGRAPILSAIEKSKSTIDLVMYGFTDRTLLSALIHAKNQGKNITVLLEPHPYESENENELAKQVLENAKITLATPNPIFQLTHQKTLIEDHTTAIIMTFNFTNSTFTNERNFALLINDPDEIHEIEKVFSADASHQKISVQNPNLIWSPNNSRERMTALIRSAKSSLEIYAQAITDYDMIGELAKAARNGIKVDIMTSDTLNNKNKNKYAYLERAGVHLHFSKKYYVHAKVIVVDDKEALLGSTNLSKPSIEDNRELSVITRDQQVIREIERTFSKDLE